MLEECRYQGTCNISTQRMGMNTVNIVDLTGKDTELLMDYIDTGK